MFALTDRNLIGLICAVLQQGSSLPVKVGNVVVVAVDDFVVISGDDVASAAVTVVESAPKATILHFTVLLHTTKILPITYICN